MDSAFSLWLWRWLSLPGWQVLATQWLALSCWRWLPPVGCCGMKGNSGNAPPHSGNA